LALLLRAMRDREMTDPITDNLTDSDDLEGKVVGPAYCPTVRQLTVLVKCSFCSAGPARSFGRSLKQTELMEL
jgi:hypothetical protein